VLSETLKQELARYALGPRIRALRSQKELRLAEVSKRSGLSSSLLSKIERGQSVPSIAALQSIATALEVTLPYFFPKPRRSAPSVTRPQERIFLPESPRSKEPSFDFECLNFAAIEPRLNCYRARFRPNATARPHAHPGSEFLFVLEGRLQVSIVGDLYVLEDGDSMYFDSGLVHTYSNAGDKACSALVVTFPTLPAISELDGEGTRNTLRLRGSQILWRRTG
jgi:transcriptional regulator with XRE-family HTH domain